MARCPGRCLQGGKLSDRYRATAAQYPDPLSNDLAAKPQRLEAHLCVPALHHESTERRAHKTSAPAATVPPPYRCCHRVCSAHAALNIEEHAAGAGASHAPSPPGALELASGRILSNTAPDAYPVHIPTPPIFSANKGARYTTDARSRSSSGHVSTTTRMTQDACAPPHQPPRRRTHDLLRYHASTVLSMVRDPARRWYAAACHCPHMCTRASVSSH